MHQYQTAIGPNVQKKTYINMHGTSPNVKALNTNGKEVETEASFLKLRENK